MGPYLVVVRPVPAVHIIARASQTKTAAPGEDVRAWDRRAPP
jgi:hypothetical protein